MAAVRTASFSLVVAALIAFAAAPAQAQDAEKARQLFQQGSKYYDLGQFDKAIEAWQQGYDQKSDPGFLYNIAQAYRQKQDAAKAIFFYKGYLRNSPKAHNRADVEQKIAALQKQLDAGTPANPPNNTTPPPNNTGTPPNNTTTPPNNGSTVTQMSPTEPPPGPEVVVQQPPPNFADAATPTILRPAPPPTAVASGRLEITGAIGPAFWSSGVNGEAKPSFVLKPGIAYYFGQPMSRLRFRAGALFGLTFMGANEDGSNVYFLSVLLDPGLEIRLTSSGRWYGLLDLGLGIQMLTGLEPRSRLLAANETLTVNGVQGLFETRVAATVGYRWLPDLAVFTSLASSDSKQKQHFYAPITRAEWLFGAAYRF